VGQVGNLPYNRGILFSTQVSNLPHGQEARGSRHADTTTRPGGFAKAGKRVGVVAADEQMRRPWDALAPQWSYSVPQEVGQSQFTRAIIHVNSFVHVWPNKRVCVPTLVNNSVLTLTQGCAARGSSNNMSRGGTARL
jgi:hypothetical protein